MKTFRVTAKAITEYEFCMLAEDQEQAEEIAREMLEDAPQSIEYIETDHGDITDVEAMEIPKPDATDQKHANKNTESYNAEVAYNT